MITKKIKIDRKQFMKMVKEGHSKKDIMDEFGIKTYAQFDSKYNQVAIDEGLIPALKGRKAEKKVEKVAEVNKRGSLIIPKKVVEDLEFKENDKFDIRKTKSGISLRLKVKDSPKNKGDK